ncbi:CHRD domain-containing protein [Acidimicrobiia bacterium EGI L10123]|uniref:CHRD domain-containing protein n=1 Tax=Salinilacustrithrix flava TaxID=2957203 RepID=UPI003D7C26C0|nr:CHRD domain-containing protein [Acidimicrobiia bacterium EGI L10123]
MKLRTLAVGAAATGILALTAAPAQADHTKGKKYFDLELTPQAAVDADDPFGAAPEGSVGTGAMYLNHGQERFCLFLDFDLPEDVQIVALHLHEKAPGEQNGGIAIDASDLIVDGGESTTGCMTGDRDSLRGVLSDPDEYYINAHTNEDLTVVRTELGRN